MTDTPDTAESIQADAIPDGLDNIERQFYDETSCVDTQDRYREAALIEARNYIGEPRTPFTKAIVEILDRGLRR